MTQHFFRDLFCCLLFFLRFLQLFVFLDFRRKLFVFLALGVQVVEVEHVDDVVLLEDELLDFPGNDCRNSSRLFPVLEEDQSRKLAGQGRGVDVELRAHVGVPADINFS